MCIPWAIGVAWSRVAKGRHFPLDVLVGALFGFLLGWFVEDYLTAYGRTVIKTIGGIGTSASWGHYVCVPFFAGNCTKKYKVATLCFYLYALTLLYTSLPASPDVVGGQTILRPVDGGDGGPVCKNYW